MRFSAGKAKRRRILAAVAAAALAIGLLRPADALAAEEGISVVIDRAKVMRISRPADTVIIGNPVIADATIQDNQTLIITGKSFGVTNLIVLDASGNAIADETVTVTTANDDVVTLYKRATRETLSCTPDCSPSVTIGDNQDTFAAVSGQVQTYGTMTDTASRK